LSESWDGLVGWVPVRKAGSMVGGGALTVKLFVAALGWRGCGVAAGRHVGACLARSLVGDAAAGIPVGRVREPSVPGAWWFLSVPVAWEAGEAKPDRGPPKPALPGPGRGGLRWPGREIERGPLDRRRRWGARERLARCVVLVWGPSPRSGIGTASPERNSLRRTGSGCGGGRRRSTVRRCA
jgi:hypothetical protein